MGESKKVQQGSKTYGRKQRQASKVAGKKLRAKREGSNRHFNGLLLLLTHPINDPRNGQAWPRQTEKLIDQSETKHEVGNVVTMTNKGKTNMHKNEASYGHKCIIDMQVSA